MVFSRPPTVPRRPPLGLLEVLGDAAHDGSSGLGPLVDGGDAAGAGVERVVSVDIGAVLDHLVVEPVGGTGGKFRPERMCPQWRRV